ncbi:MAG: glucose-1-phosphate thymidylyltransferase [Iamia sp.]
MKGLILAGGRGTRLRPLTHTRAKQLVPVANTPILFYGLAHMAEAGITDVGVIIGETGAEVRAAVGDGSRWGIDVTYLPQDEPLGLAHCIQVAGPFLGADDVVMYLGDNMLQHGLRGLVDAAAADRHRGTDAPAARVLLSRVADPRRFGVAELGPGGQVVRVVEKPEHPASDLALTGAYLFTPAIHDAVAAIVPSPRGELEIADALQWLIDQGHGVAHELFTGWWLDTGKKDSLLEANRRVLGTLDPRTDGSVDGSSSIEGRVVIEAGAEVINSVVRGPAIIGPGAKVVDSRVGPHVAVGPGVLIEATTVEDTVLLDRVHLRGVPRLVESLVGRDAEVVRTGRAPGSTRLMVSDDSSVELP